MAPPRHHSAHHHPSHNQNHGAAGQSGSHFQPLGMQTSGTFAGAHTGNSSAGGSNQPNASGLPPAPTRVDATQAQTYRLQDAYWSDEEEDLDCPLCLEEIDISDANFKPCPCGYQICRFCWHHIKSNLNGRCPACRRKYSDNTVEFKAMSQDEIKKLTQAKKQKEREKKDLEQMNRKHLANMRVVQKNLVYVVGMDPKLAREELIPTLRSNEYFGQYGRISKILISKRTTASKLVMGTQESAIGVYVTYVRKEDAARAIIAIDGSKGPDGRTIRASYGTTKYCTTYLRNLPCTNPICTYLHEPGEEADSFTKEDLTTLRHAAKDSESRSRPTPAPGSFGVASAKQEQPPALPQPPASSAAAIPDAVESSALPKTASWATAKPMSANHTSGNNAIREQELPPLPSLSTAQSTKKGTGRQTSIPQSPAAKSAQTKKGARPTTPSARPDSPVSVKEPEATNGPPGLFKATKESSESGASSNSFKKDSTVTDDALHSLTPGKHGIPPGLSSRSATPSQETASSTSEAKTSAYQPSSNAQAVMDDMRIRRDVAAAQQHKSPFPDFDKTLSSFQDGEDFSFSLEEGLVPAHLKGSNTNGAGTLSAFTPFSLTNGVQPSLYSVPPPPGIVASTNKGTGTPPPPGLTTTNTEAPTYTGRFDPFAPGAGESLLDEPESSSSPLHTLNQLRHTLDTEQGRETDSTDEESQASRFGFAKRQESFKTPDDLLGFVKRGALSLGDATSGSHVNAQADWLANGYHPGRQGTPLSAVLPSQNFATQRLPDHTPGREDSLLLAQLMGRRSGEQAAALQDPAIMSFTRQQQEQHNQGSPYANFAPTANANPAYTQYSHRTFA